MYPDRLDDYHSPRYQRFHLFKLLQIPPDGVGVLDMKAGRFLCAGRYVRLARALEVPTTSLLAVLNARDSALHRYWRVGTTSGSTGESQWEVMRAGSFVSIGWGDALGNLTEVIGGEPRPAKQKIRDWLLPSLENAGVATRKAGEVFNFCRVMEENDLVLACEGQDVIGVGRVRGSYRYDNGLTFPHLRPVEWLLVDRWKMPESEGLHTTVCEIGRKALNLLELERRLFVRGLPSSNLSPLTHSPAGAAGLADVETVPLPGLDPLMARIEATLTRKGQIVLYGPPGTGKTYWALKTARELAARKAFNKTLQLLTRTEQTEIDGAEGLVRVCTFHPGFGYEDFIEGLRPRTDRGQMLFEPRAGVFKRICAQAIQCPRRNFYLVVDEINRGDLPRIFGELITVLEYDKRGVEVILPLTGDLLIVPRNVFMIGTMNSADRSISLMDTAMRRRFAFLEMMPDSSVLGSRSVGGIPLGPWLDALNSRLRRHLKRDARHLQVGHSFFLPAQQVMSVADFGRVIREEIIPLLEEYCYDDFLTLKDILGGELVDVELGRFREDLFDPNREESLLQALTYEEMAAAMPAQAAEDDEFESPADASDDGDEA
jgi:5-methylcytosine-specific restriction protein B